MQNTEQNSGPSQRSQIVNLSTIDVLSYLPCASLICDRAGKIVRFNSKLPLLLGDLSLKGRSTTDFGFELTEIRMKRLPLRIIRKDGRHINALADVEPIQNECGETVGVLAQLDDTVRADDRDNQLEQANRDLIYERESAKSALNTKSDFLSNMSHELRTPLNAIIGMSDVLWETDLSEEQRQVLSVLRNGGRSLLAVINDILEFSRLENGKLPLEQKAFHISEPIQRVYELLSPMARAKGLELSLQLEPLLGEQVFGDPKRLEQILMNIIGNAVKFTERGTVVVRAKRKSEPSGQEVSFSVADTGIGIPKEKLCALFKRFSQVDTSITKTYGGTGLGLAICKQLIDLMEGSIWVESKHGKGTTFHFTLKLPVVNENPNIQRDVQPKKITELEGLKILVVEDSKDNAFLITKYLQNIHSELHFAENGEAAVEMFEKDEYDLILMDMQMPGMDGYAATKWIRVLEKNQNAHVPIIALTAFAFTEEIQKSIDAGCDAHLSKPVDKRTLLNAIATTLDQQHN